MRKAEKRMLEDRSWEGEKMRSCEGGMWDVGNPENILGAFNPLSPQHSVPTTFLLPFTKDRQAAPQAQRS
jgi:hypothetical protein